MKKFPILFCFGILFIIFSVESSVIPKIEPSLLKALENNEKSQVNILVSMQSDLQSQSIHSHLKSLKDIPFSNRTERLNSVKNILHDYSNWSQKEILQFLSLESPKLNFKQLWITNQIIIQNADLPLISKLLLRTDVSRIEEEQFVTMPDERVSLEGNSTNAGYQWGVEKIRAPSVYSETTGQGIVVASIDTGTFVNHEALTPNFREHYGWFDAVSDTHTRYPFDDQGHGTHTIGSAVGTVNGIGVAPGAQWISCKAGDSSNSFSTIDVIECAQWVLCPTDYAGQNEDCSQAPHVVTNSWGWQNGGLHFYDDVIDAWRAAWIVPIFCNGNNGLDCSSTWYPAEHPDVIGVGSTTDADRISSFSSLGPIPTYPGVIKPDVAGPGTSVYSSYYSGVSDYGYMSGTSMATPHVAGLVALMLSKNGDLSFDQIRGLLEEGAVHTSALGGSCGGVSDTGYPNFHVGYGRIDAYNSVSMVAAKSKGN